MRSRFPCRWGDDLRHRVARCRLRIPRGSGSHPDGEMVQLLNLGRPCRSWCDLRHVLWSTGLAGAFTAVGSIAPDMLAGGNGLTGRGTAEIPCATDCRVPGDIAPWRNSHRARVHGGAHVPALAADHAFGCTLLNLAAACSAWWRCIAAASGQRSTFQWRTTRGLEEQVARMTLISRPRPSRWSPVFRTAGGLSCASTWARRPRVDHDLSSGIPSRLPFAFFNGTRSVLDAYHQTPERREPGGVADASSCCSVAFIHLSYHAVVHHGRRAHHRARLPGLATWRDVRYVRSELVRRAQRGMRDINVLVVIRMRRAATSSATPRSRRAPSLIVERRCPSSIWKPHFAH